MSEGPRPRTVLSTLLFALCAAAPLGFAGCGATTPAVTAPTANQVSSYFGSPYRVSGSSLLRSVSTFDRSTSRIGVTAFIQGATAQVPSIILNGGFVAAPTGFLTITEDFATGSSGVVSPQNPPITGAWAVEIPGAGALANFLTVRTSIGGGLQLSAAPAAMVKNSACPNFPKAVRFNYVTVPSAGTMTDIADYGGVDISSQGAAVTLNSQPYRIGPLPLAPFTVTGGCSDTFFGPLTAFPLNSFGTSANVELIAIGESGLLVSSFLPSSSGSLGAFGGGTGVIGVAKPSAPVDLGTVVGAKYNGFIYAPQNSVSASYDITDLASAFGDNTASSQACAALQSSLAANNGQGAATVPVLPSANTLYGGEFLTNHGAGAANDPSGASGSENCDVAVDLGIQDSAINGSFPNATVFIGANYPPFSASNPWNCSDTGTTCAVSFPAAAVVGQVRGQFVILVTGSGTSSPAARLPNNFGNRQAQPVGIYLFQKTQ